MGDALEGTSHNVVVVVFSEPPFIGWMLYYSGFKRPPVISKQRSSKASPEKLAEEALKWLAHDLRDTSEPVGVKVVRSGSKSFMTGIDPSLTEPFVKPAKNIFGDDREMFDYLFSKSPVVELPRVKIEPVPLFVAGPVPIPVSAHTVIAGADASFSAVTRDMAVAAGTGWVFEFHDTTGSSIIETGSRAYEFPNDGHTPTINTFEVYAVRDALEHMSSMRELVEGSVSRIVLYSDSTFAVRALMNRDQTMPLSATIEQVHDFIAYFSDHGISVEYMWTKGHAGNKWNIMADKLAGTVRQSQPTISA